MGEVVESSLEGFAPGDLVRALGAWQEYSLVTARDFPFKIPRDLAIPDTCHLGVAGGAGLAAWFGIHEIAQPQPGQSVVVSSAAGTVGSVAAQLAREIGCHVVGICGSEEKCNWLYSECGIETTINYRTGDLRKQLKAACPKGIDVYFDNTGGDQLEAALSLLAPKGCIVLCGATSQYDQSLPPEGPRNYLALLESGGRMQGLLASHHLAQFPTAMRELAQRIQSGHLAYQEHLIPGLDAAPAALQNLLNGAFTGKVIVAL
jgi:NADPH-dependent curcumin reductase CurA